MNFPIQKRHLWFAIPLLLLTIGAFAATRMVQSQTVAVPAGTALQVRLSDSLSTKRDVSGESFAATVAQPVVIDGKTVIPKDAPVTGRVVSARESGRLAGVARMRLELTSVNVNGTEYPLSTTDYSRHGGNHRKRNWAFLGGGAGGGALIGALAAGGKGAAIGGPIGFGAGIAAATLTGRKDFTIPAESLLTFELEQPVNVKKS